MNDNIEAILKSLQPNPEDVLLIRGLFSHPGWQKYRDTIDRDIEFLNGEIDKITDGKTLLIPEVVERLKQLSVLRYALKTMIVRHEQLLDDVSNPLEEVPEEVQKDNFTVPENGA